MLDAQRQIGQDDWRTEKRTVQLAHIGYARVSTLDQDLALQLDALAAAGCAKVFDDRASGARADRPGLQRALDYVREGDVLVVWKLDRLGRSLPHLIETVAALQRRGVASTRSLRQSTPPRQAAGWYSTSSGRSGSSSAT
jgi:DNA invertase Pin-like site-specific DNA recombinase